MNNEVCSYKEILPSTLPDSQKFDAAAISVL